MLTLLTACPRPYPPPLPPESFNFVFPDTPGGSDLRLAAIYFEQATPTAQAAVKVLATGYIGNYGSASVNTATLSIYGENLNILKSNAACVLPFKTGELRDFQYVMVTPDTVKTCNVYFSVFRDVNGDGVPQSTEELFITQDVYSYASSAFTFSATCPDGRSTYTGSRANGWSLVRHEVLQPADTPDRFLVSMNSVPTTDLGIAIRMHAESDFLTSMGVKRGLK
ncbi:hypothetical protein [Deinococcus sp.]|uniref:hypothetical protein n=1 Tax=Deinococcus sp. TaxID=47478 RepID=UPI002869B400|nr:hypothetical protein [Deinococcus sp.]